MSRALVALLLWWCLCLAEAIDQLPDDFKYTPC
jgi:hypothetical protein